MKDDIIPINEKMKEGLARAYADEGFKSYIENTILKANLILIECLDKNDDASAKRYANRIKTWEDLLSICKQHYINFEKIKAK
jgi:hypothetical protein